MPFVTLRMQHGYSGATDAMSSMDVCSDTLQHY